MMVDTVIRFRIVCAWCGTIEQEGDVGADVSHTICPACTAKHFPDTPTQ